MFVSFFINGFPVLPEGHDIIEIPNDRLQSLPKIGDVIFPFLQDYSYVVMDVKRYQKTSDTFLIEYVYNIHLKPHNDAAIETFERQFKRKA